jgi:hypothetical protein
MELAAFKGNYIGNESGRTMKNVLIFAAVAE